MHVLILGANSEIGMALAHKFACSAKANLYLASRNMGEMAKNASDLVLRYQIKAETLYFDATDYESHKTFYQQLDPEPDVVILAFGYMGDQASGQKTFTEAKKILDTNLTGAVSILETVAEDFETRKEGTVIVLSSVAGERGRKANYLYGAAKAGLTAYTSGLRNRLSDANVRVLTVLPGFVQTKMTKGMQLPPFLLARPEQVAADIFRSFRKTDVIYSKRIWRFLMFCIRNIPESLFKKMNI